MDKNFEALDRLCNDLALQIDRTGDSKEKIKLKRKLYETKLSMIDIIDAEKEARGISARDLIAKVESMPNVPRYALGFPVLDGKFNGGIEVGTLIQLAGQSFAGKTHFVLQVLSNIAGYAQSVFFNFEMGDRRIARKLKKILRTDAQLDNLILDSRTRHIDDIINEIRIYAHKGVKFFAIDSKMKIESNERDDYKRYSEITNKLGKVCQENDIIIFMINQMNEDDIKNKRLAFKGSGDQQYDSDISLFLMVDKAGKRTLVCNKNRQDEREFVVSSELNKFTDMIEIVEYISMGAA